MFDPSTLTKQVIFNSKEPGSVSGEFYEGIFEVRKVLTPSQKAMADVERRNFLGNPERGAEIDPEVSELAFAISQLKVRVIKGPTWWNSSNGLKSFVDDNVLVELTNAVLQVELDFKAEIKAKAEAAKKALGG